MKKEQLIKMTIWLLVLGVVLYFGLDFYFNRTTLEPANIIVNTISNRYGEISINLPKISGDEKISELIEKENSFWQKAATEKRIVSLNITTTYYDDNYLSLLYSGLDGNKNKIITSIVIDLTTRKALSKGQIVDVILKSKFTADGKEDPKMKYSDDVFSQFDTIYLEKGTDGTINGVFMWKSKNSTQYNSSKLNGYEIIKSII